MSPERLLSSNIVGRLLADLELLVEIESTPTLQDGIHRYVFAALFSRTIFDIFIVPFSITTSVVVNEDGVLQTVPISNYLTSNESVDEDDDEEDDTSHEKVAKAATSRSSSSTSVDATSHPQQPSPRVTSQTTTASKQNKRQKLNHLVEAQNLDEISLNSSSTSSSTNSRRKRILIERNSFIQAMKNYYKDIIGVYFSRKNGYRRILDEYPYKKASNAKRNVPYFELRCVLVFLIDMLHLSQTEADWEVILKHAYVIEALSLCSVPSSTSGVI